MAKPPVQRTTADHLRQILVVGDFDKRVRSGELRQVLLKARHPSPPRAAEPFCTQSQLIAYVDDAGNRVAILHRYLRPDGELGASGQADPKRLLYRGVLYFV
jgi:hypothetical protein